MSDITLIWNVKLGQGDWELDGPALATGNDLATAALVSLFTDRAANPDDVIPDGTTNARGWWGDLDQEQPIGSRLWLLQRAKQTTETLNNAVDYCREALQWFIDDKIAVRIDVVAQWVRSTFLGIQLTFYKQDGSSVALGYAWAWNQVG